MQFLQETTELHQRGNYVTMIYDGDRSHIQFNAPNMVMKSEVVVTDLPAHTWHVSHPLDVPVFASFKAMVQKFA